MNFPTDEEYDNRVMEIMRQYGTITPNKLASVTKRKHETAKHSLTRLEEKGLIYSTKIGNRTYYTLMPTGKNNRVKPDGKRGKNKTDRVARPLDPPSIPSQPEFPLHRANNRLEVIHERGFVCYPLVTGSEVTRDFVRTHIDGEFQVKIHKIGQFKTTDYIADSDIRIRWSKTGLSTNVSMIGKIQMPNDREAFTVRTVSGKNGKFNLLSIWPHARYIYYIGIEQTAELEFQQQISDICSVLKHFGWQFEKRVPQLVGNIHYGFNDTILGTRVGRYNESDSDQIHYDHSHGIPEAETYSELNGYKTDPEVVEIMVKLPDIVKSLTVAINETTKQITMLQSQIVSILDIQTKTVQVVTESKQPETKFSNDGGMYQ